jgi:hypothetical protein
MTSVDRIPHWISAVGWAHAGCLAALGVGCHVAPQALFGDSAWIPMARFAVGLLGAALLALAFFLVLALRAAYAPTVRLALLAAVVFDVQAPILLSLHPASYDFLATDIGIPWMLVPLVVIFGLAVPLVVALSSLNTRRAREQRA